VDISLFSVIPERTDSSENGDIYSVTITVSSEESKRMYKRLDKMLREDVYIQ